MYKKSFNKRYKETPCWTRSSPFSKLKEFIAKEAKEDDKILDVGCGTGVDLEYFRNKGYNVFGIDFSKEAVRKLGGKRPEYKKYVKRGDITDSRTLTFPENFFDLSYDIGCLHHIEPKNYDSYFKNLEHLLKDDNRHFIYVVKHQKKFQEKEGFSDIYTRFFEKEDFDEFKNLLEDMDIKEIGLETESGNFPGFCVEGVI